MPGTHDTPFRVRRSEVFRGVLHGAAVLVWMVVLGAAFFPG